MVVNQPANAAAANGHGRAGARGRNEGGNRPRRHEGRHSVRLENKERSDYVFLRYGIQSL